MFRLLNPQAAKDTIQIVLRFEHPSTTALSKASALNYLEVAFETSLKKSLKNSFEKHIFLPLEKDLLTREDDLKDFEKVKMCFPDKIRKNIKNFKDAFANENILEIEDDIKLRKLRKAYERAFEDQKKEYLENVKMKLMEKHRKLGDAAKGKLIFNKIFGSDAPWTTEDNVGVALARKWRTSTAVDDGHTTRTEDDSFAYTMLVQADFVLPEWQQARSKTYHPLPLPHSPPPPRIGPCHTVQWRARARVCALQHPRVGNCRGARPRKQGRFLTPPHCVVLHPAGS